MSDAQRFELLVSRNSTSMDDIRNLFKDTIAEFMENGLEADLDDELGYSKYDYKNKDTDNILPIAKQWHGGHLRGCVS